MFLKTVSVRLVLLLRGQLCLHLLGQRAVGDGGSDDADVDHDAKTFSASSGLRALPLLLQRYHHPDRGNFEARYVFHYNSSKEDFNYSI